MKISTIKVIEVERDDVKTRKLVQNETGYMMSDRNFIYTIELEKNSFKFLEILKPFGYHVGDIANFKLL